MTALTVTASDLAAAHAFAVAQRSIMAGGVTGGDTIAGLGGIPSSIDSDPTNQGLRRLYYALVQTLIAPEPWTAPTLLNAWENFNAGYATAAYCKDPFGFVHLRGLVAHAGGVALPSTLFTLPVGYRPLAGAFQMFSCQVNFNVTARVDIDAAGNVVVMSCGVDPGWWTSLNGITFDTR